MNITLQNLSFKSLGYGSSKKQKNSNTEPIFIPVARPESKIPSSILDKNHNRILVQKSTNFGKNIPASFSPTLSQKLTSVFSIMQDEDIILVGKNKNDASKLLENSAESINKVIKKIFLIEDTNMNGAFAIKKREGLHEIVNLNKNIIFVKTKEKDYFVKPKESAYILDNEKIVANGVEIPIKFDDKESNLTLIRKMNVKPYDFTTKAQKVIKSLNTRMISEWENEGKSSNVRKVTFADVGGQDKAIQQIQENIIAPLKNPEAFKGMGLSRGAILVGPPGTGKTLLAQAAANESDATFFSLNGQDMESMWVGETQKNWRDIFKKASEQQPAIIFIDEIDGVARKRGQSVNADHNDKTVNQLLTLMTDADEGKLGNVFILTATNNLEILDKAFIRSKRNDIILLDNPDLNGSKKVFNIHTVEKNIAENFDKEKFAERLHNEQFSPADIAAVADTAHLKAYRRQGIFTKILNGTYNENDSKKFKIEAEDFEEAYNYTKLKKKLEQEAETRAQAEKEKEQRRYIELQYEVEKEIKAKIATEQAEQFKNRTPIGFQYPGKN